MPTTIPVDVLNEAVDLPEYMLEDLPLKAEIGIHDGKKVAIAAFCGAERDVDVQSRRSAIFHCLDAIHVSLDLGALHGKSGTSEERSGWRIYSSDLLRFRSSL